MSHVPYEQVLMAARLIAGAIFLVFLLLLDKHQDDKRNKRLAAWRRRRDRDDGK